ncbi:hypothetical protein G6F56_008831 [Rhizopus delemar]|nr:hypothetical protein G6F56_008831 [Rhizopus delemar]
MSGTSSNLQTYITNILSSTIPTSDGQYAWNVPTNIETGSSYALAFKGDNGQTTYSTYFTIMGAAVGTVNKNSTSTSATISGSHSASASQSSQSTSSASSLKIGMAGFFSAAALLL